MICCVMANAWRGKNQPAFKIDDFMLFKDEQKRKPQQMDWRVMKAILKGISECRKKSE